MSGLLSTWLPQLDVPESARLVAVNTAIDDDGNTTWTVTFKQGPAGGSPLASPAKKHLTPGAAAADASHLTPASAAGAVAASPPRPSPLTEQQLAGAVDALSCTTAAAQKISWANSNDGSGTGNTTRMAAAAATPGTPSPMTPPATAFPPMPAPMLGAMNRLFPLRCAVKTYAWGRHGGGSLVGRLAAANDAEFVPEDNTPYAELWMGTHPSGPSMVLLEVPWRTVTPLYEWLKLNPSLHGQRAHRRLDDPRALTRRKSMLNLEKHGLPFLFKVLSVRTALSIQAHPDKVLAQQLHTNRPDLYKDDNHKPEMSLAVSRFEALCSFQKANYVLENCRATPELVGVVGDNAVAELAMACERAAPLTPALPPTPSKNDLADVSDATVPDDDSEFGTTAEARLQVIRPALQNLFNRLMTAKAEVVKRQLDALMLRIAKTTPMLRTPVDELAVRLHEQYPGDVGVFCVYLLNYIDLKPGEALFLGANEPHAYISGECVECMAASDNVVRAGLTPKFKDVDVLTSMLTYIDGPPSIIYGEEISPHVRRYATPVEEFLVDSVALPAGSQATLPSVPGVSIVLVLEGGGVLEEFAEDAIGGTSLQHTVEAGAIFIASADTFFHIRTREKKMTLYRAAERGELNW